MAMEIERQQIATRLEFIDAHCHLNLLDNLTLEEALADARNRGVSTVITSGGSAKDNFESARLAEKEHVFAVVGIGPDFAATDSAYAVEVPGLIRSSKKIVGIGEIGMDAKVADKNSLAIQKEVFSQQLKVAKELDMPVVIHSRGMLGEVASMLIDMQIKRVMFHFFEGDEKQAVELASRGYLISIPPAQTEKRKRVIKEVNLKSIVAETDSPVVGKTPADVIGVCETIAQVKGVSLEEVAAQTTENIRRLFYI